MCDCVYVRVWVLVRLYVCVLSVWQCVCEILRVSVCFYCLFVCVLSGNLCLRVSVWLFSCV